MPGNVSTADSAPGLSHLLRAAAAAHVTADTRVDQLTLSGAVADALVVVQIFPSSYPGVKKTNALTKIFFLAKNSVGQSALKIKIGEGS